VIYGDTDSIMINTAVPSRDEFESPALLLGDKEERESPAAQKARLCVCVGGGGVGWMDGGMGVGGGLERWMEG
jgi:hypothetical protein